MTIPESSGTTTLGPGISLSGNQLAALIPTFDPSIDNVEQWSQKIELLTQVWPEGKLGELATRIILNCKGSASAKLQLKKKDLLSGTVESISQIVEIVGGQFESLTSWRRRSSVAAKNKMTVPIHTLPDQKLSGQNC